MFQKSLNVIDLRLKLPESRELNIELPADLGELLFHGREDLASARRRSCRAARTCRPAAPRGATFATFTALASPEVRAFWSAWACLSRHVAKFHLMCLLGILRRASITPQRASRATVI